MSVAPQWVPPADIASLVGRTGRTIYAWAKANKIRSRLSPSGSLEVDAAEVIAYEPTVRRGRPPGTARPNTRHADMSDLH
jgi:hypothetical protein